MPEVQHQVGAANPAEPAEPADGADAVNLAGQAYPTDQADTANLVDQAKPGAQAGAAKLADQAKPANPADAACMAAHANPAEVGDAADVDALADVGALADVDALADVGALADEGALADVGALADAADLADVADPSAHTLSIARQIGAAHDLGELRPSAARIQAMVAQLHASGCAVERIAWGVARLNAPLIARLWGLLAPPELVANSCLLVMGSEGRGEQIVKTDQDNALLLRDGFDCAGLAEIAVRFNVALTELGYPPCPGQIMLSNPLWRAPLGTFKDRLRDWVYGHDPQGPMRLAIFFDSLAVAGDDVLLVEARDYLDRILVGSDSFLARFASAIELFQEPTSWWQWLTRRGHEQTLDLKKLGIFPIVHGVRALALQQRLRVNGSAARLQALVEQHQIDATLAGQVLAALHLLMTLRLGHQLRQLQSGQTPDNLLRPSELRSGERAQLRDAQAVVRRFRDVLQRRFRLDAL